MNDKILNSHGVNANSRTIPGFRTQLKSWFLHWMHDIRREQLD
jgi:hypothetical protein